jgi:hypothetical protein
MKNLTIPALISELVAAQRSGDRDAVERIRRELATAGLKLMDPKKLPSRPAVRAKK